MKVFSLWRGVIEVPEVQPRITMDAILYRVAWETGVPVDLIRGDRRTAKIARARQTFMRDAHEAGKSYSAIGRFLGRDHSTVIHACDPKRRGRYRRCAATTEAPNQAILSAT